MSDSTGVEEAAMTDWLKAKRDEDIGNAFGIGVCVGACSAVLIEALVLIAVRFS